MGAVRLPCSPYRPGVGLRAGSGHYPALRLANNSRTAGTRSTGTSISVRRGLVRRLVLSDRLIVGLLFIVREHTLHARLVPTDRIVCLFHEFFLLRRNAFNAFGPKIVCGDNEHRPRGGDPERKRPSDTDFPGLPQSDSGALRARSIFDRSRQNVSRTSLGDVVTMNVRLAGRWVDKEPQNHVRL